MVTVAHDPPPGRRLPAGRKAELATYVAEVGEVTVAELAERFEVSSDTVRRDLDQLDADGLVIRTHGGAVSPSGAPRPDTELDVRRRVQTGAKEVIGKLAAGLVQDGTAVLLNGGTTVLAVARALHDHRDLTLATNNLLVPSEVSPGVVRDMLVFGGSVRTSRQATVGPVVFRSGVGGGDVDVQCDLALIAVGAASVAGGYSVSHVGEAAMMRQMMERADRVAILVDSSKFGGRLFARVADLGRVDHVVTDATPPAEELDALAREGVELLLP